MKKKEGGTPLKKKKSPFYHSWRGVLSFSKCSRKLCPWKEETAPPQ